MQYFIIDAMKEQMTKENSVWCDSYILEADNISCKKYILLKKKKEMTAKKSFLITL